MSKSHARRAWLAGELYDLLADNAEGMTGPSIQSALLWDSNKFATAVQALRDLFSEEGDSITLVAEPQGQGEPWLYVLIDGSGAIDEEQSRWAGIMINHVERRILTMRNVLATAVKATRASSTRGQKARIYHLHIGRALEEVRLLANENGLSD